LSKVAQGSASTKSKLLGLAGAGLFTTGSSKRFTAQTTASVKAVKAM